MSSIEFDFSELNAFAVSIGEATKRTGRNVEKAVAVSALKGRRAWQASAKSNQIATRGTRNSLAYPYAVDFDEVSNDGGVIGTELGPNLEKKQAGLGIIEDSPGGVSGAPQRNYLKAEQVIEKDLVIGVLKAVEQGEERLS